MCVDMCMGDIIFIYIYMVKLFCSVPLHRNNLFPVSRSLFPRTVPTPPLLMVQTTARIASCSNLQSDWENSYFCKGYMDIRIGTQTDQAGSKNKDFSNLTADSNSSRCELSSAPLKVERCRDSLGKK